MKPETLRALQRMTRAVTTDQAYDASDFNESEILRAIYKTLDPADQAALEDARQDALQDAREEMSGEDPVTEFKF